MPWPSLADLPQAVAGLTLPGLALASLFLAVLAVLALRGRARRPSVRKRPFLTPNEAEFLGRLEAALPEMRIHAQVAMGALLMPVVPEGSGRRRRAAHAAVRARYDRKVVDFLLQSRADGSVVAVVELDDRTHVPDRDRRRDAMMASAGYRTIRWDSRRKPNLARIREVVLGASQDGPANPPGPRTGASR